MAEVVHNSAREILLGSSRVYRYPDARDYSYGDVASTIEALLNDAGVSPEANLPATTELMLAVSDMAARATTESGIAGQQIALHEFQGRFQIVGNPDQEDHQYVDYSRQEIARCYGSTYTGFVRRLSVGAYTDFDVAGPYASYGLGLIVPGAERVGDETCYGYWFIPILGTHATVLPPPELS